MDAPHLRIAVTTNSLIQVDANFAAAKQVVFYDVARDSSEFVDVIHFSPGGIARKGPGGGLARNSAPVSWTIWRTTTAPAAIRWWTGSMR